MTRADEDLKLWKAWHKSRSSYDLQRLLDQLLPIMVNQVNRWGGTLSKDLLMTEAKILATEAIQSYDVSKGAALATHVTNRLQKLSRLVYTHSQALRLPENKVLSITTFKIGQDKLRNELGRDPTDAELSDHLGWSINRTQSFNQAINHRELLTSGEFDPGAFTVADEEDPVVGFVYHDMAPKTQKLFSRITGYGGASVLTNPDLMKKFKLSQGQLSYQKQKITDLFNKALKQGS